LKKVLGARAPQRAAGGQVWSGREKDVFGQTIEGLRGRRSGVPALVVVQRDGDPLAFLNAEAEGARAPASRTRTSLV